MVVKCPNCNEEVKRQHVCPFCHIDIDLYKKIKQASKKLYNKGLEQAHSRDLSGAIESLEKSLRFDKKNIQARNLLGLIYYEIGQVGFALKHWILSSNFKKEENLAFYYIKMLQRDKRTLEKQSDAIKKYNQALQAFQQKSEDIAFIQLKSIVVQHPQFLEAHALLALASMMNNEPKRALESIEKILSMDISHPIALRYYQYLQADKIRPVGMKQENLKTQAPRSQYSRTIYQQSKKQERNSWGTFNSIGLFITGAICMLALVYIFIMPSKVKGLQKNIYQLEEEIQQEQQVTSQQIQKYQQQIDQLTKENNELQQTNETLEQEQKRLEERQKIQQITLLLQKNKIEEAAPIIYSIDPSWLESEQEQLRQQWIQDIYPKAARIFYNQGLQAYNQGSTQYEKALNLLNQSLLYAKDQYFSDDALYFIAVIYENTENVQKAISIYETLLEEYPSSNQKYNAQKRLSRLQSS